ncbi:MAG: lipase maturation factor family protein [Chloroflexota bacterium]|nr:lipase maturation factor family protein [Chloroflexota bacterium]
MEWLTAPDHWLTRAILERAVGAVYLIAFVVAARQFPALLGERGILPAPEFLRQVRFADAPSLFHLRFSDRLLRLTAWTGAAIALAVVIGLPQAGPLWLTMLAWFVLWALYLSIVNVGQTFYAFGWESLLLEAGFLAIFLGNAATAPPTLILLAYLWLAFRIEFGAGLIKLRGDRCWRELTCMDYHHETQPMPNPLSWYFHRLPRRLHRVEVLGNYVAQLVAPVALLLPFPVGAAGAFVILGTQGYLVVSGNYAWLNVLTMTATLPAIPDAVWRIAIPVTPPPLEWPAWFSALVVEVAVVVALLSYWPVRNLLSRRQLMNYSFNRWHLVNTYGAFGSVSRERYEVVVEGARAEPPTESDWLAYEFKGKPGDPRRRPPQVAPYHLRLDWLMWFLPLSPFFGRDWFPRFVEKLLEHDPGVRRLLRHDPFADAPPRYVRARLYLYRYTTADERRRTGAWWSRTLVGEYLPAVTLRSAVADAERCAA